MQKDFERAEEGNEDDKKDDTELKKKTANGEEREREKR